MLHASIVHMAYVLDDGESLTISDRPMRLVNGLCEVADGSFHCELSDEALRILTGCASVAFGQCIPIHATIGEAGAVVTVGGEQNRDPLPLATVGLGPIWPPVGGAK